MNDIKKYINSGIIEKYCLGLTSKTESLELEKYCLEFPELKKELKRHQLSLEQYLSKFEIKPSISCKNRILQSLEDEKLDSDILNAERTQFNQFVDISEYSNVESWQNLTHQIIPPKDFDIHSHVLYKDSKKLLSIVWINDSVPHEVHDNTLESFLVLEGSCTCNLGDEFIEMKAGSFLEIPLNVVHNLTVTSERSLKFILTKKKIA